MKKKGLKKWGWFTVAVIIIILLILMVGRCEKEPVSPVKPAPPIKPEAALPGADIAREKIEAAVKEQREAEGIRAYLARFSEKGEKLWAKALDGPPIEWAEYAAEDEEGNII
ncbi:MAG TPA: hypothetical protein ENN43_02240, partial [bacterium]|nr:hypothetical protein [bacterium]